MEEFKFVPSGVCSREFSFEMEGDIVKGFKSAGGCPGNLLGLEILMKDKSYLEIIEKFQNVKCGTKQSSCPMQISLALQEHFKK